MYRVGVVSRAISSITNVLYSEVGLSRGHIASTLNAKTMIRYGQILIGGAWSTSRTFYAEILMKLCLAGAMTR